MITLPKLRTSPSNIAKIMESGCGRSLFFHAISEEKGSNTAFLKKYYDLDINAIQQRETVKNQFRRDAGNELELDILTDRNIPAKLQIETYGVKGHYYPPVTSNAERVNEQDTLALLRELADFDAFQQKHNISGLKYLYQLTLTAAKGFQDKYGFDPMFDFNASNPDLIMITETKNGLLLHVIDIKMAEHIRLKQKIQVALYALLLKETIKSLGLEDTLHADLRQGYIWHKGQAEPTAFDMEEVLPHVERFLREDISALAQSIREYCGTDADSLRAFPEDLPHRLTSKCEYCDYMPYCLKQGRSSNDFQRIPYLSSYGQRCLEDLHVYTYGTKFTGTMTCQSAAALLKEQLPDPDVSKIIQRNPSLREYIKETDGRLLIERYTELLEMTAAFDYRAAGELAYKARAGKASPAEITDYLNALARQKEQDCRFLKKRLAQLQECIDGTAVPEDSPERRRADYLCRYQQQKLEEAEEVLALSRAAAEKLSGGASLSDAAEALSSLSYRNLSPKPFEVRSRSLIDFPKSTANTVSLFITAQKDELTDRMFALAYSYVLSKSREDALSSEDKTCILIAGSEDDTDRIEQTFIDRLHSLFASIHDYNQALGEETADNAENGSKLRLQCFVMDRYEADNLISFLYDMLERSESTRAEKIMDILSWFQDEHMADQNQTHASIVCDHPFVSLTQTVRRMFILPAEIAYSFDDIAGMFAVKSPFHKKTDLFSNYFNNSISAGFIREHWNNPADPQFDVSRLEKEIAARLTQASLIRQGILNELETESIIKDKKILLSYAPVFCLPARNRYAFPLLSKLNFQCQYEEMLARLNLRSMRLGDIEDLITDNVITPVRYLGSRPAPGTDYFGRPLECHDFEILSPVAGLTVPDMGLTFASAHAGALQEFCERGNLVTQDGYWGKFTKKTELDGSILHITLEHRDAFSFETRMLCYMFERYTNWTSPCIIGGLLSLNSRVPFRGILADIDEHVLSEDAASLFGDPCAFVQDYLARHRNDEKITSEICRSYEDAYFAYPFVPSQQKAFLQFYNQNLSLIQGPPGTGKTNFIAMSVLIYLIRQRELGMPPQKIYVTSNSHVALENVLHKVAELSDYMRTQAQDLPLRIYQVEGNAPDTDRISVITQKDIGRDDTRYTDSVIFDDEDSNILLGSTVWALEKVFQRRDLDPAEDAFDVVIVDEASQVRLIDSTIALAHVKKDGKILLVGDHEQLPPIIQGIYSNDEETPFTAGSVFQYFIDHDLRYQKEHGALLYSKRLNEQFRMNRILSLYPSIQIYEGDYHPANQAVASQKLRLAPAALDNAGAAKAGGYASCMPELCEWLMDPEYPFVLCNIKSSQSGSFLSADAKKTFEIELVRQLSDYCIRRLCRDQKGTDNALYDDADNFWHEGMFIIAPHHEHINRLREAVKDLRREDLPEDRADFGAHAFIDTVDKMQGQEAEIALVSYGISDEEQALREKEFVFNRNRLNVSITRGKKKMILILTDVLTDKQLELMAEEDKQLIDSIAFMNSIKAFAQSDPVTFYSDEAGAEIETATRSQFRDDWAADGGIIVETFRKKCADQ